MQAISHIYCLFESHDLVSLISLVLNCKSCFTDIIKGLSRQTLLFVPWYFPLQCTTIAHRKSKTNKCIILRRINYKKKTFLKYSPIEICQVLFTERPLFRSWRQLSTRRPASLSSAPPILLHHLLPASHKLLFIWFFYKNLGIFRQPLILQVKSLDVCGAKNVERFTILRVILAQGPC